MHTVTRERHNIIYTFERANYSSEEEDESYKDISPPTIYHFNLCTTVRLQKRANKGFNPVKVSICCY